MISFQESKTKDNLMRAFAGESQARNRYTFAASAAKAQKLHIIEAIFRYTADQEKEHAEIFYNLLAELSGMNICVDGKYPVDISDSVPKLLRMAQHNEYEEATREYPAFGQIAQQEGFAKAAAAFNMIAAIEQTHGDRFGRYAELLEQNRLLSNGTETKWLCLNCGHIHTAAQAPEKCPVCAHEQGYFIRLSCAPFES